jgi:hypothetical protein
MKLYESKTQEDPKAKLKRIREELAASAAAKAAAAQAT